MFRSVYTWYLECLDYLRMRKRMEAADNRQFKTTGGRQRSRDDCRRRRVFLSSLFFFISFFSSILTYLYSQPGCHDVRWTAYRRDYSRILAPIYANLAAESEETLRNRVYGEVNPVDCQARLGPLVVP